MSSDRAGISFAFLGLFAVILFGSWSVVISVKHPQVVAEPALVVWVRLIALFLFAAIASLGSNPMGQRTRWVSRLTDLAFVIPALTAWVFWVNLPVGDLANYSEIPKIAWCIGIGIGVVVLLVLRLAQIIRPGVGLYRLNRNFWNRRALGTFPMSSTITLAAFPSILLSSSGSWTQWSIVTTFYVLTVLAMMALHRPVISPRRRIDPRIAEQKGPEMPIKPKEMSRSRDPVQWTPASM